MYISRICFKNFRCFGPEITTIELEQDLTFLVGNNGSGKSTMFLALAKIFGATNEDRTITKEDFYLNTNERIDNVQNREMFIDIMFEFPEIGDNNSMQETLAAFEHVIFAGNDNKFKARIRLESIWNPGEYSDDVSTKLYWINTDEDVEFGEDFEVKTSVLNQDRNLIQLRYIPAFRHSNAMLKHNVSKLIKILVDYVKLEDEKGNLNSSKSKTEEIDDINKELQNEIKDIKALKNIKAIIDKNWKSTHDNNLKYYNNTQFDVTPSDINELLGSICLKLVPNEQGNSCDINNLSDGQVSLLYITLSLTLFEIEQKHYHNEIEGLKPYDKIPAIFTIFALEEPENHLSPFYLTRIFNLINQILNDNYNVIGIVSTHSPAIIKRAKRISQIRYFTQILKANQRYSKIKRINIPSELNDNDCKYITQGILVNPEIYFAKLVILGEGDSEEIIITNIADKLGINLDSSFVAFTKLGGRHVNHMWRILNNLNIPYITLLDFDLGRFGGGFKRFIYIINQLNKYGIKIELPENISISKIKNGDLNIDQIKQLFNIFTMHNIYFSKPLDIDMMMINKFENMYNCDVDSNISSIDTLCKVVLKTNGNYDIYDKLGIPLNENKLKIYQENFCKKSKITSHYTAIQKIMELPDEEFQGKIPKTLLNLINRADEIIRGGDSNASR